MIEIRDVSKSFQAAHGTIQALTPVDLSIREGEFVCLVGPSGCGKSTLLRLIAGLEVPTEGSIRVGQGEDIGPLGFVFQEAVLLPWKSILDNIRFPLDMMGKPRDASNATANDLIAMVGLTGFEKALPSQLSGGMRQRAAIARALAYDPPVLLMDEPFSAVDLMTRDTLNDELLRIWTRTGKTVVLVTHSIEEAVYLADRVVVMSARPGRIDAIHESGLPRPRGEETKAHPDYLALTAELRRALRSGAAA
jgi:NitT/TauT family transport system ATP-binding protein